MAVWAEVLPQNQTEIESELHIRPDHEVPSCQRRGQFVVRERDTFYTRTLRRDSAYCDLFSVFQFCSSSFPLEDSQMNTHWTFRHCERSKKYARDYWWKKTGRLERLLSSYHASSRRIDLTLYRHQKREEWELRCVLHLPTGTLTVEDTSSTVNETIDNAIDKLAACIARHKNDLRKRHLSRKRKHRRRQFAAASEFLAADATLDRANAFSALLMPYADQLYDHARRELKVLEDQGDIPKGECVPSDLVDELFVRACETYGERFADTSIDVWLFDQLNKQLEEIRMKEAPLTLVAPTSDTEFEHEKDHDEDVYSWMERLIETPEPLSLEELVPDERWGDAWDSFTSDEQRERLAQLLQELPKQQRQALMLIRATTTNPVLSHVAASFAH